MPKPRTLTVATLLFLFAILPSRDARATHILGMNISYEWIQGDSFEITLDFWRYCGGSAFNNGTATNAASVVPTGYSIYCPDQGFTQTLQASVKDTMDITPICAAQSNLNSCPPNGSWQTGLLGVEWYVLKDTIDFGSLSTSSCSEWMFVFPFGARNTGTNYFSQPSIVAYDKLRMNDFPTNSSPQFSGNTAIPFYCAGQQVSYNWNCVDPDGDSLVYHLDTAWNSWTSAVGLSSVNYQSGYSPSQPMPGVTINSQTGQLDFTAQIPTGFNFANYAIAVRVDEYENGTGDYIGSIHRDVQFIVLQSCNNLPPVWNPGPPFQNSNILEVCAGQSIEFDMLFYDLDTSGSFSNDSLTTTSTFDQVIPGGTWTVSGTNPDTVHFEADSLPSGLGTVFFTVQVSDDFCPNSGLNSYTFGIQVGESTQAGPDTAMCSEDTITLRVEGGSVFLWSALSGDPIQVGTNFGCTTCTEPWVHPGQTTVYHVQSNLSSACGNSDTVVVEVFDASPIDLQTTFGGTLSAVEYCANDSLDVFSVITPGGTFYGSGVIDDSLGIFDPGVLDPGPLGDTTIGVNYVYFGSCPNIDTIMLHVRGVLDATILTTGPFCDTLTQVQLIGATSGGVWGNADSSANPTASGVFNPSAFTAPDSVYVYYSVNDSGCTNTKYAWVRIRCVTDTTDTGGTDSNLFVLEPVLEAGFTLHPNPAAERVTLTLTDAHESLDRIRIFNLKGVLIRSEKATGRLVNLDIRELAPGEYLVEGQLYSGQRVVQVLVVR